MPANRQSSVANRVSPVRRAFTLIELLVIVAIMATMVTVGVVGLNSSRASTRQFGAARDVMAMVRRARSLALVTQKPVVITYSNKKVDDEDCANVEIQAEKIFASKKSVEQVQTLSGEIVSDATSAIDAEAEGETLEDILSPQSIPLDVLQGLKIKALDETDELNLPENETRQSKISIFSTADNVSRTLTAATETKKDDAAAAEAAVEDDFKVVFAANGMASPPHRIWIYRAESTPEKGICIRVDRFGEPKCEDFE